MKAFITVLILISFYACHSARPLPALADGTALPQNNGYVIYLQADTLPSVTMPEINRVAQAWIKEHTQEYAFEWQVPVYKTELMYAGQIRPEKISAPASDYYTRRTVHYFLTVSASDGLSRVMLTNFSVEDAPRRMVPLEKQMSDQALCHSVDSEATALLKSMSQYIRKTALRPL